MNAMHHPDTPRGFATRIGLCILVGLMLSGQSVAQRPSISEIQGQLADLQIALENGLLEPFSVQAPTGGICNTAAAGSANPIITIDSDGSVGSFVVNSIIIKADAPTGVPLTGFRFLSINTVTFNGTSFDTRTGNLLGPTSGSAVRESADLMGTPVRRSGDLTNPLPGGNFPHQIVAAADGRSDINVRLFCRSDVSDFSLATVLVSGWKRVGETISVTYIPGA